MKKVIIIIVAVIVVAAAGFGVYSLVKKDDTASHDHAQGVEDHGHDANAPVSVDSATATVITYTDSGFSPASITVESGATVTIKNDSSREVQFSSDSHPTHTINSELNVPIIKPGQSRNFVVEQTGTFGYHDHLDSSQTGTIIVQ